MKSARKRRFWIAAAVLAGSCVAPWFLLTSPAPVVPLRPAPTAEQVGAGRDAYRKLRGAKGDRNGKWVTLGPAQLDGLGALASHGLRPDRVNILSHGSAVIFQASRPLVLGRWVNITLSASGASEGFPKTHLKIGAVSLPPRLSRLAIESARSILRLRGADVPPLDQLVRKFSVQNGGVSALIRLPRKSGVIDEMAGAVALPVDSKAVVRVYCALADRQRKKPSAQFADQVHRAFSLNVGESSQVDFNRAAFIALGMLLVDQRVGDFAPAATRQVDRCRIAVIPTSIYGRFDWTKHWTLSAAIAAGAGAQLSAAAGEWKELADSLDKNSQVSLRDPSGFSMADLAADRAGFRTAVAAVNAAKARSVARKLAAATAEQLLPHVLIEREEGLTSAEFVSRYGGVDDARFKARVRVIDQVLDRNGVQSEKK
ncbi:MAG TPA: hypothetical protein VK474_07085 [Chthoniobacterales bacterium]|nr:hypothetical protein [Chthoniobacterales bacterium]